MKFATPGDSRLSPGVPAQCKAMVPGVAPSQGPFISSRPAAAPNAAAHRYRRRKPGKNRVEQGAEELSTPWLAPRLAGLLGQHALRNLSQEACCRSSWASFIATVVGGNRAPPDLHTSRFRQHTPILHTSRVSVVLFFIIFFLQSNQIQSQGAQMALEVPQRLKKALLL